MNSTIGSNQQDLVVLLDSVPSPAADASEPFVVADERRVVLRTWVRGARVATTKNPPS
jgi:hypothetical protein